MSRGKDKKTRKERNDEKVTRNRELYRDWKAGMSQVELVTKYQITLARIYEIINRMEDRQSKAS